MEIITCSECGGKGVVPVELPKNIPTWAKKKIFERKPCKTCNGSGLVAKD